MAISVETSKMLSNRWDQLTTKVSSVINKCEEYARWTLPGVFPPSSTENVELQLHKDSLGAQCVNHLSNKVISTLFPAQRLFFRLYISEQMREQAKAAMQAAQAQAATDPQMADAEAQLNGAMMLAEKELAAVERKAADYMDMVAYRPQAITAAKLLIITGNALLFNPRGKPVQVYNLRNYRVLRDLSGGVIEIMTKENKAFETFAPEVQVQIQTLNKLKPKHKQKSGQYENTTDVTIYTRIVLEDDGKFHVYQSADDIELDTDGAVFTADKLPWIPLTWNLIQGEDYGRGLVEEYSGAFHAVNTLNGSLLNIAAIMGDIKFLVSPQSLIDIVQLNNSPPGSYHPGKEGDVSTIQVDKLQDARFIAEMIERHERRVAQAFLLNSAIRRDAERVTAEEIRQDAQELETSNGGVYSRLAATWQQQQATVLLDQIGFDGKVLGITPKIITGMDSLSRIGELDNIRMMISDLAMLNAVPEDIRRAIKPAEFLAVVGTNRQVDFGKFTKTTGELTAEIEAEQQKMMELQQNQAQGQAQVAATREFAKGA
jgi:hypothetical protein